RGDERERRQRGRQQPQRRREQGAEPDSCGRPPGRQVRGQPDQWGDDGDGPEDRRVEVPLGQYRLVEQRQPGGDQPVEGCRQPESPRSIAALTAPNAAMNPTATRNEYTPITGPGFRPATRPTSASDATDSALCPSPRVSSTSTNSGPGTVTHSTTEPSNSSGAGSVTVQVSPAGSRAMLTTVAPSPRQIAVRTGRTPIRSRNQPTGTQTSAPRRVAHRFS